MSLKNWRSGLAGIIGMLLLFGIGRAATSRYDEQLNAFLTACKAEQQKQGLTNRKELFARYPTPEVSLCRTVRLAPGSEGEVVATGNFPADTRFLFDNDSVQVLREAESAGTYRARVKVADGAGPGVATLHVLRPVSGANATCRPAVWISAKYEWRLTASNGWRVLLQMTSDGVRPDSGDVRAMLMDGFPGNRSYQTPNATYRAEFYRGQETQPFRLRDLRLSAGWSSGPADRYSGSLQLTEADQKKQMEIARQGQAQTVASTAKFQAELQQVMQKYQAELAPLQAKIGNPKLSQAEKSAAIKQLTEVSKRMSEEQQAVMARRQKSPIEVELEKEKAEFGCESIDLSIKAGVVEGHLSCGPATGRLTLKGAMKTLAP